MAVSGAAQSRSRTSRCKAGPSVSLVLLHASFSSVFIHWFTTTPLSSLVVLLVVLFISVVCIVPSSGATYGHKSTRRERAMRV